MNEDEEVVEDIVDVVVVDEELVAGIVLFSYCCWSLEILRAFLRNIGT